MNGYPIQPAKVQRPPLRDETLARDRLLDWLAAKIHHRVILVLADAGYGKTTLLADFSRRTRLRTLWYRLDDDDRDWISFLSHLVAAGREHDPEFAPTTAAMLSDLATGGPTREAATDVFLRELPTIAEHGAVLILDDFHLVDESPDVRQIAARSGRASAGAAVDRLREPADATDPVRPAARLGRGRRARDGRPPVRRDETARLFTETYGRELEPDVLADVTARTEGWAASLQLVQAALRDRSPAEIRRFVRGLSGADQELYDYLAEEVVGDLPDDLQQFLMRTSILQVVTPDLAGVVTGLDAAEMAGLTAAAERLTLLTRPVTDVTRPAALPPARARVPRGSAAFDGRTRRPSPCSTVERPKRPQPRLAGRRLPLPRGRRPWLGRSDDRGRDPRDHGQRPAHRGRRRDRSHPDGARDCPSSAWSRRGCICESASIRPPSKCRMRSWTQSNQDHRRATTPS